MTDEPTIDMDDDYDDITTPEEVLRKMTLMWQNELCAPCLLPSQMELVDILLDQIQGMEDDISRQRDKMQLRISLHRSELQRISFLTSDYVRCRLRKIEANPNNVIEEHNLRKNDVTNPIELLSETELKFAEEYALAEAELFEKTVIEFMPVALKKIPVPKPDHKNDMVYAKVLDDDVGNVTVTDWRDLNAELVLEMEKSSCHLIPFESVKPYVEEGKMQLL